MNILALLLLILQARPECAVLGECVYFDELPTCADMGPWYLCCDSDECIAFLPVPECRGTMCCGTRVYQAVDA
jgi:hypothetical protein